jgi:hypothetical protein
MQRKEASEELLIYKKLNNRDDPVIFPVVFGDSQDDQHTRNGITTLHW